MMGRIVLVGLVCFLLGAGTALFVGPWVNSGADDELPVCPYLASGDLSTLPPDLIAAVGAYEAVRETLMRDSLDGVPAQASVIARAFAGTDPKISSVAKRLAEEVDVESARRAFMRLSRLMEKQAARLSGG
jgi:hypothetical protein